MSNWKQVTLGVVGAAIGYYFGGAEGAYYGAQIGLALGSALFPGKLPGIRGPRLADNSITESQVGSPIPWVFGTQVIGGIVIWASPVREEEQTENVGGGGSSPTQDVTSYHYFRSWAVLLTDGEIAGVRRVWFNGKLRLDMTPRGVSETDNEFTSRIVANQAFLDKVTIYGGTETQMPDPTMESFLGAGNVPAYRGYSYVVFEDLELLAEDGNRMPAQMKFEVCTSIETSQADTTEFSQKRLWPWSDTPFGDSPPLNSKNDHIFDTATGGVPTTNPTIFVTPAGGPWTNLEGVLAAKNAQLATVTPVAYELRYFMGYDMNLLVPMPADAEPGHGLGWTSKMPLAPLAVDHPEALTLGLHYNHFDVAQTYFEYMRSGNGIIGTLNSMGLIPGSGGGTPTAPTNTGLVNSSPDGVLATVNWNSSHTADYRPPFHYMTTNGGSGFNYSTMNCRITVKRVPTPPIDPCTDPDRINLPGYENYVVLEGRLQYCGPWEEYSGPAKVLAEYTESGGTVSQYPLNPTRPMGHVQYNDEDFWTEAYEAEVLRGRMPAGLTYGVHYPKEQAGDFTYYARVSGGTVMIPDTVTIGSIVAAICARVGSKVNLRYDTSELTTEVIGFKIGAPMTARGAIDPLRSVGLFDCVEDGITLRFPVRGKAPVAVLEETDLGAFFSEQERLPMVQTQKLLEMDLPRQVRVHYQDPDRDFDPGEEVSPVRVDTRAESVVDVELAVAITADQAAQVAEILLRDAWASRYSYQTTVDISQAALQASDCLLLPVDRLQERVRLSSVTDLVPNLRQLTFTRDDDGAYSSTATGTADRPTPPKLVSYGPVEAVLLDLPMLDPENETPNAGYYMAARPLIPDGPFRSATLLRSADNSVFVQGARVAAATPMGLLGADLESGTSSVVDYENEILVDMQHGTPESAELADVLAGANMAAVGADGRWEIVQWLNAEFLLNTVDGLDRYRLTGLLRGRRGTEYFRGAATGDRFVILSAGTLGRVLLPQELVNQPLYYRAVGAAGSAIGDSFQFTARGKGLQPFAPVHVHGETDVAGNWVITWTRRDRLASDVVIPMSEAVEAYEVDILSGGQVIRTISVLTTTATYAAEKQVVDFGELQANLTIRVYQTSEAVGRSNPIEVDLQNYLFSGIYYSHQYDLPDSSNVVRAYGEDVIILRSGTEVSVLERRTKDGTLVAYVTSVHMARTGTDLVVLGNYAYVSFINTFDAPFTSKIRRFDLNNLAAGATHTLNHSDAGGQVGDFQGLATDGTSIFAVMTYTGQILRLNPADLSIQDIWTLVFIERGISVRDGKLWGCAGSEVKAMNTTTGVVTTTFSCVSGSRDLVVTPSLIFVRSLYKVGIYTHAGVLVREIDNQHYGVVGRFVAYDGTNVMIAGAADSSGNTVMVFNGSSGLLVGRIKVPGAWQAVGAPSRQFFFTGDSDTYVYRSG